MSCRDKQMGLNIDIVNMLSNISGLKKYFQRVKSEMRFFISGKMFNKVFQYFRDKKLG